MSSDSCGKQSSDSEPERSDYEQRAISAFRLPRSAIGIARNDRWRRLGVKI
jgi:hypothetical protein